MDFINAARLPVCQMRPNCFGCTKEQMNSLSLACKEPGAWLSLSGRRYNETVFLSSASLWLSLCLPSPLSHSLPPSFSRHYCPSRISYHTCPHSGNDCPYSFIYTIRWHIYCSPSIRYLPCCWKWTAGKEVISSLSGKTAGPALCEALFIFDKRESEAVNVRPHHLNLIKLRRGSWLTPSETLMAAKSVC